MPSQGFATVGEPVVVGKFVVDVERVAFWPLAALCWVISGFVAHPDARTPTKATTSTGIRQLGDLAVDKCGISCLILSEVWHQAPPRGGLQSLGVPR